MVHVTRECQWCNELKCTHCRCEGSDGLPCKTHSKGSKCPNEKYGKRLACNSCIGSMHNRIKIEGRKLSEKHAGGRKRVVCNFCGKSDCHHCQCTGCTDNRGHLPGEPCTTTRYARRLVCNRCGNRREKSIYAEKLDESTKAVAMGLLEHNSYTSDDSSTSQGKGRASSAADVPSSHPSGGVMNPYTAMLMPRVRKTPAEATPSDAGKEPSPVVLTPEILAAASMFMNSMGSMGPMGPMSSPMQHGHGPCGTMGINPMCFPHMGMANCWPGWGGYTVVPISSLIGGGCIGHFGMGMPGMQGVYGGCAPGAYGHTASHHSNSTPTNNSTSTIPSASASGEAAEHPGIKSDDAAREPKSLDFPASNLRAIDNTLPAPAASESETAH